MAAYDYGNTTQEERDRDLQTLTPAQIVAKYKTGGTAAQAAQSQPAASQPAREPETPSNGSGSGGGSGSVTTGAYDPNRNYAGDALEKINGMNGQFDGGLYSYVQDAVAGRNAKIAANQDYYSSINVSPTDTEGAAMQAYLDRYAPNYQAYQENLARLAEKGVAGMGGGAASLAQQAAQSAQGQKLGHLDISPFQNFTDQWFQSATEQANLRADYAVQQGLSELQRTEEDARQQFQNHRNAIEADAARAADNAALYAQARGDRGGIGQAQFDAVQAARATNLQTVRTAQTQLTLDLQRQRADLLAQGEFQKADAALTLAQQYLQQMFSLRQMAANYDLTVDQFNASVEQWALNYQAQMEQLGISVRQWTAELVEGMRQYDTTLKENQRQHDDQMDLNREQLKETAQQYDKTLALQMEELQEKIRSNQANEGLAQQELEFRKAQLEENHWQFAQSMAQDDKWKQVSQEQWERTFGTTVDQDNLNTAIAYIKMVLDGGAMVDDATIDYVSRLSGFQWSKDALQSYANNAAATNQANIAYQLRGVTADSGGNPLPSASVAKDMLKNGTVTEGSVMALLQAGYTESYIRDQITSLYDEDEEDEANTFREMLAVVDRTVNALSGPGLDDSTFRALLSVLRGDIEGNKLPEAENNLNRYWDRANSQQRQQINALLSNAGIQLDEMTSATAQSRTTSGTAQSAKSVLESAASKLGYEEKGENMTEFGEWFGQQGAAWCMMFVNWAFDQAGMYNLLPTKTASTREFMKAAKKVGNWHTKDYQPGDVILLDTTRDGVVNHVGIVESVNADGTLVTIEGNTSKPGDSRARWVVRKNRTDKSMYVGAFRPAYPS